MTLSSLENYGIGFQTKVISALLTDKPFLQNVNDILTEEYFSNSAHKWTVNEILKYYQKYHCPPTMDVLKVEMKRLEKEEYERTHKEECARLKKVEEIRKKTQIRMDIMREVREWKFN